MVPSDAVVAMLVSERIRALQRSRAAHRRRARRLRPVIGRALVAAGTRLLRQEPCPAAVGRG